MTPEERFADDLSRALAAERAREKLSEDTRAVPPLPEPWEPVTEASR